MASLVSDLTEAIESRIRGTFDVASLAREALARAGEPAQSSSLASASSSVFYKSRAAARTEPTSANIQHFQSTLWTRLDSLIGDMAGCCTKVYVLERVLKLKRDSVTQASFLDDALTVLDDKPTFTFWTTLSTSFETASKEAARSSAFVQQTLSTQYPRLLRLFHEFFAKIALQSDTVYTQHSQSPETVLILRSISTFEALYLSRCSARLNEAIAAAFSGGSRQPPAAQEGMTAARVLINELDAARFDPLLVTNVAKAVGKALEAFVDRVEGMVSAMQLRAKQILIRLPFFVGRERLYCYEHGRPAGHTVPTEQCRPHHRPLPLLVAAQPRHGVLPIEHPGAPPQLNRRAWRTHRRILWRQLLMYLRPICRRSGKHCWPL